jgi:hypothetical protein
MIYSNFYFNELEDEKLPKWFVIDNKKSDINWSNDVLNISMKDVIDEHKEFGQFGFNVSVYLHELSVPAAPNQIGINLNSVKCRLEEHELIPSDISNLIIQVTDIEELLSITF